MPGKTSLLARAAVGAICAVAVGAAAEAAPARKARPAKAGSQAALRAEVRQLQDRVTALEAALRAQATTQQQLQAQAQAAQARADQSAAAAQAAQAKLDTEIIRLPSTVKEEIAAAPPPDKFRLKGVTITPGGFLEAAGIYRSRNESADISSSFNAIPYKNVAAGHTSELRGTARQSRLTLLVEGNASPLTHLAMYGEFDFQAAAQTANSNESNSYNPRIRLLYGTIDWDAWGLHLLAGQNWSLLTMNTNGILPRSVVPPPVIEGQYVPGFAWTRQPQVRLTKNFGKQLWVGISLENPQTTFFTTGVGPGAGALPSNATFNAPAGNGFNSANTLSLNHVPDVILKAAYDAPIAGYPVHLEVFGLFRDFYSRRAGENENVQGGGFGGGAMVSVIPKVLDLQISGLVGNGVGRYGTSQLPDATIDPSGRLRLLHEDMILGGATWHATPDLDLYLFAGREESKAKPLTGPTGLAFGYGNPAYVNAGCFVEGSPFVCNGNTREIDQITGGFWTKPYQGDFGRIQWGAQYSYTERKAFEGVGGAPTTIDHMVFTSLRYYPF